MRHLLWFLIIITRVNILRRLCQTFLPPPIVGCLPNSSIHICTKKRPAECLSRALMKSASIYIPMGNEKNEDCNDWEANLCIDAQVTG